MKKLLVFLFWVVFTVFVSGSIVGIFATAGILAGFLSIAVSLLVAFLVCCHFGTNADKRFDRIIRKEGVGND